MKNSPLTKAEIITLINAQTPIIMSATHYTTEGIDDEELGHAYVIYGYYYKSNGQFYLEYVDPSSNNWNGGLKSKSYDDLIAFPPAVDGYVWTTSRYIG